MEAILITSSLSLCGLNKQMIENNSERYDSNHLLINNIHEKISPFWLVKSSAVFLIQYKNRKKTKHSDWSMIRETHRWPIKSFVFKSSARPGWRNWTRAFLLLNHLAIFSYILLISNHMIFLLQFGIKKHL